MMRTEKLRILTLSIMALSIKTLSETDHNDIQYNAKNVPQQKAMFITILNVECRHAQHH